MPPDPMEVPEAFWAFEAVRRALSTRDIGAVFRLVAHETGASQTQLGAAVGLDQGYVSRVMAGRKVTSIDVLERIADGLTMPDAARAAIGLAGRGSIVAAVAARQVLPSADRSWRDDVRSGAELWRGDVNRRDVLRQTAFSSAGYAVPALRWFSS